MKKFLSFLMVNMIFLSINATSYFVSTVGTAGASGLSWDASVTIENAISKAVAGDVIYISSGIYDCPNVKNGRRIQKAVSLIGGYNAGDDVSASQPSKDKRAIFTTSVALTAPVFSIYTTDYAPTGNVTMANLVFNKCKTTEDGAATGGLIRVEGNCPYNVKIENCDFIECEGVAATAIKIVTDNASLSVSHPKLNFTIENCKFDKNKTTKSGKGVGALISIYNGQSASNKDRLEIHLNDLLISNNSVEERLIGIIGASEVITIDNCVVENNINVNPSTDTKMGCGITFYAGGASEKTVVNITNSLFYGNQLSHGANTATVLSAMSANSPVAFNLINTSIVGNHVLGAPGVQSVRIRKTDFLSLSESIISNNVNSLDETKGNRDIFFTLNPIEPYTTAISKSILNGVYGETHLSHSDFNVSGKVYDDYLTVDQVGLLTSRNKSAKQLISDLSLSTSVKINTTQSLKIAGKVLYGTRVGDRIEIYSYSGALRNLIISVGGPIYLPDLANIVRVTDMQGVAHIIK